MKLKKGVKVMKSKKLSLHAIILAVSVLVIIVYSIISSIALKPKVTEGEFPFSITYELDGETVTIDDVYRARYDGNGGYANTKSRIYIGEIGDMGEGNTVYTLKTGDNGRIELWTHFHPDYLMGDTKYDYFDDKAFEPGIYYYDVNEQEFSDEETLSEQGVKLISFEYPTPIKNSFTFSHISYLSGAVVLPALLISLLTLIAVMIFVKKEKELKYKAVDIISIIFNFIISLIIIPLLTILALLIDIEGGGPEFYYQAMYFIPTISLLSIGASIALRRKGSGKKSLLVGFIGPAVFALYLIVSVVLNSL